MVELYDEQLEAISKCFNGCILNGDVGSGKSLTSLGYYWVTCGGSLKPFKPPKVFKNLLIITTAKKRDSNEWEFEMAKYGIDNYIVDSWNNIKKYEGFRGFVIFDEQRVVGKGTWVKSFIKIAKANEWILLTATPGDCWMDYIPVFLANGFYKNRTEFITRHVVWKRFSKFPQVDRYFDLERLERLRDKLLIPIYVKKKTQRIDIRIEAAYLVEQYRSITVLKRDPETGIPFKHAGELCYALRKIVNSDFSRVVSVIDIYSEKKRVIVFYNFDYELEIMKENFDKVGIEYAEWNGHKHQPIPESDSWIYLVQYNAGCEGWNCIKTDTMIFYSNNYSYKVMEQAKGRIDRMNTTYSNLYYYTIASNAPIDIAIAKAIASKRKFNEKAFEEKKSNIYNVTSYATLEERKRELKKLGLPPGFRPWQYDDDIIVNDDGVVLSCKKKGNEWKEVKPWVNSSGIRQVTITNVSGEKEAVSVRRMQLESD